MPKQRDELIEDLVDEPVEQSGEAESESAGAESPDATGDTQTALLPKTLFGSELEPGDVVTLRITRVFEREYEAVPIDEGAESDEELPEDADKRELRELLE